MESRQPSIQKQLVHIEQLIKALDSRPDSPASIQARDLVQTLLEIHGAGLEQTLELIHGLIMMKTRVGGTRVVDMLSGEQLPRIC